jgi:hypothetical protein
MPLKDVEVRKVASGLTTLANEKQKEQRDKASGKKKPKTAGKPALGAARLSNRYVENVLVFFPSNTRASSTDTTQTYTMKRWTILVATPMTSCRLVPLDIIIIALPY